MIVDGADIMAMQNLAHVQSVFAALSGVRVPGSSLIRAKETCRAATARPRCLILPPPIILQMPKQQRSDIDFMRVRPWYLNGWCEPQLPAIRTHSRARKV